MKTWCRDNWSAIDLIHMARYTRDRMLVCYTCNTNRIVDVQGLLACTACTGFTCGGCSNSCGQVWVTWIPL